jgi:hypothetical protein
VYLRSIRLRARARLPRTCTALRWPWLLMHVQITSVANTASNAVIAASSAMRMASSFDKCTAGLLESRIHPRVEALGVLFSDLGRIATCTPPNSSTELPLAYVWQLRMLANKCQKMSEEEYALARMIGRASITDMLPEIIRR